MEVVSQFVYRVSSGAEVDPESSVLERRPAAAH